MNATAPVTAADSTVLYFAAALPHFLLYFLVTSALAVAFMVAYTMFTPQKEFTLISEGKTAPALSLIGSFLGFAIPLGVVVGHSVNLLDLVLWGAVVLVVQAVVFLAVSKLLFKTIAQRIADNCTASGVFLGGISLGFGVLQAACMIP